MTALRRKTKIAISFSITLCAGIAIGYFIKPTEIITSKAIREKNTTYQFTHPLLAVGVIDTTPSPEFEKISSRVEDYISQLKQEGGISTASVYFINYAKGGSFSINANEKYMPASLMKVVIMVTYLKQAENDRQVFSSKLTYTDSFDKWIESDENRSKSDLTVGKQYTIETLINKMIIDSDNGATNLLLANIDRDNLNKVYKALGIAEPNDDPSYTISTKDYTLFFRILYNATYLSSESSEKALSILSQATFKDGLIAGLPVGTVVSHKFGEHAITDSKNNVVGVELHDCGVVYGEPGPYLLCIMTKGKTLTADSTAIAGITKIVANEQITKK